jgi:ABC-type branched-subunit amino acid transport system substrate-binding protein
VVGLATLWVAAGVHPGTFAGPTPPRQGRGRLAGDTRSLDGRSAPVSIRALSAASSAGLWFRLHTGRASTIERGGSMDREHRRGRRTIVALVVLAVTGALTMGTVAAAGAGTSTAVRGFDGTTITVAGFGIKAQLPTLETGAQARFKRFNDTNELKGVKIKMTEFADDGQDNATALSDARRLVTETGVFAIVPEGSANTPGTYLTQQHVPWFGGGFDTSFCSAKATTKIWGFGPSGCIVPQTPSFISDTFHSMYTMVSTGMKKKHPTFLSLGNDNATGKNAVRIFAISAQGAGFNVVGQQDNVPFTAVSDYSPFVKNIMTADHGKPPDSVFCNANIQCLGIWPLLKAQGYQGYFVHGLYSDAIVKAFDGSYVNHPYPNLGAAKGTSKGFDQMAKDIEAVSPGAKLDLGHVFGYTSADVFISALLKAAKSGKSGITPENVQKAASTLKWELPGFMKTTYPKTTVMSWPSCFATSKSDGTTWNQVEPWTCSNKTFSPNLKVGG